MALLSLANYENGLVRVDLEYDDSTKRATGVVCTNNSASAVRVEVWRQSDRLLYSQRFPPGDSRINIPTNVGNRIQLTEVAAGKFQGFDLASAWPVA